MRCLICNRVLKSKESLTRQIGPTCYCRLHPKVKCITIVRKEDFLLDEARQYKLFEEGINV
jgi:hypothetical protein